jgi:hypothetical protein
MLKETLLEFYERDLKKLENEISLYRDEDNLWVIKDGISNSAGNLCLHLLGNLNHFIGATLGDTGYIRHRDDEFALKNIPRQDLLLNINNCMIIVKESLNKLTEEDLGKDYPLEKHGKIPSNTNMLIHLLAHLSYHLGQINYHRRLIENN